MEGADTRSHTQADSVNGKSHADPFLCIVRSLDYEFDPRMSRVDQMKTPRK